MSRLEAYKALSAQVGVDTAGPTSAAEDYQEAVEDPESICQWALATSAGEIVYVSTWESLSEAMEHANEILNDDLYSEAPIVIVDLDDPSVRYTPTIVWKEVKR